MHKIKYRIWYDLSHESNRHIAKKSGKSKYMTVRSEKQHFDKFTLPDFRRTGFLNGHKIARLKVLGRGKPK